MFERFLQSPVSVPRLRNSMLSSISDSSLDGFWNDKLHILFRLNETFNVQTLKIEEYNDVLSSQFMTSLGKTLIPIEFPSHITFAHNPGFIYPKILYYFTHIIL